MYMTQRAGDHLVILKTRLLAARISRHVQQPAVMMTVPAASVASPVWGTATPACTECHAARTEQADHTQLTLASIAWV